MKKLAITLLAVAATVAYGQNEKPQSLGTPKIIYATAQSTTQSAGCTPIEQYGGGTSVANNSTAFNTALSSLSSNGGCITFGPGKYVFTTSVSYTYPSANTFGIRLVGTGQDATVLNWPSSNGLVFNVSNPGDSFQIDSLTFTTSSASNNTFGFTANGPSTQAQPSPVVISSLNNVSFRGDDCYACNDYWGTAIYLNGWSNVNLVNSSATGKAPSSSGYSSSGIGLRLNSTSTPQGVQYNIFGGNFQDYLYGIEYGGFSQGLTINQTNFVGNTYGVYIPAGAGISQMNVSNSQFNNATANIADLSGILYDQISNNLFIEPGGSTGVYLQASNGFNITGNTFVGTGPNSKSDGIILNQHIGSSGIITGNLFSSLSIGAWLASASSNVNVQSNSYTSNSTNVLNNGTNNVVGGGSP